MPRYDVSFVLKVWVQTEVIAPTEEVAREKARKRMDKHLNSNEFTWLDGGSEICGITNLSLLKSIP